LWTRYLRNGQNLGEIKHFNLTSNVNNIFGKTIDLIILTAKSIAITSAINTIFNNDGVYRINAIKHIAIIMEFVSNLKRIVLIQIIRAQLQLV
jgi:hypothetical protein